MREIDSDQVFEVKGLKVDVQYDSESNCLLRINNLEIPPLTEVIMSFGVRKVLLPFEDYPNDPNRGFNVPQMPIYYKIKSDDNVWSNIYS